MKQSYFLQLCAKAIVTLGGQPNISIIRRVWKNYSSSPARRYHDKGHILFVADWVLEKTSIYPSARVIPERLILSTFYHDDVYEVGNPLNEEQSAEEADKDLRSMGVKPVHIAQIIDDIMYTRHVDDPETMEGKYMVDADLASLSLPIDLFWQNTNQLYLESGKSPGEFAKGNAGFLRSLLRRPRIYYSPCMDEEEKVARRNMATIIERLERGELEQIG